MTKDEYFVTLVHDISDDEYMRSRTFLLKTLSNIEFFSEMENDIHLVKNILIRKNDAGYECDSECSVLDILSEMCYEAEAMMYSPDAPDRRKVLEIFLYNMGLDFVTNDSFSEDAENYINIKVNKFLNKSFARNGEGGNFVKTCGTKDLRKMDLLSQVGLFCEEILDE